MRSELVKFRMRSELVKAANEVAGLAILFIAFSVRVSLAFISIIVIIKLVSSCVY